MEDFNVFKTIVNTVADEAGLFQAITAWCTVAVAIGTIALVIEKSWDRFLGGWKPPKLQMLFQNAMPYITNPTIHHVKKSGEDLLIVKDDSYYYHVGITNLRKRRAKKCVVMLREIYTKHEDGFQKRNNYIPGILKWAGVEEEKTVDIYREQERLIDVGYIIRERFEEFDFDIHGSFVLGFRDQRPTGLVKELAQKGYSEANGGKPSFGIHRLLLTIYGDNFQPSYQWFELSWSGEWKDSVEEIKEQLTLRKCSAPPERA